MATQATQVIMTANKINQHEGDNEALLSGSDDDEMRASR